ncbi:MAG: M14 family zinc carboxypeptidase [Bacteroidales bacterium]
MYSVASEGIDNDGDGRLNEDGIGGLDLHRNYPENWRPESEATGRGYTQGGAGEYPLSETETRAVVTFLLSHPNVYVVNSMDTSVPMHLRPPSTSASEERMYPEDLKWYKLFDETGKKITGYAKAGDVYNDYGGGSPLFGHGPDFGYFYFGAIWYGDEIWNGARNKDYDGNGTIEQKEILRWDDEENDSLGFRRWKPAHHPVYGDVEIGGFDPKFFSQNPPAKHLLKWIKNEGLFNIEMVKYLPELKWEDITFKKIKEYKADSADYEIRVTYSNTGQLPTALKQANLVRIVSEDKVSVSFDRPAKDEGKAAIEVIDPASRRPGRGEMGGPGEPQGQRGRLSASKNSGYAQGGEKNTAVFKIRIRGIEEVKGKATVSSTRGGILKEKEFSLKLK